MSCSDLSRKPVAHRAIVLICIAHFFSHFLIAPSRDMLVRSLTPRGQAGTVFGFVSTGFNVGGIIAPLVFGYLLDQGAANGVFWIVALASLLTELTVVSTAATPEKDASKMPAR